MIKILKKDYDLYLTNLIFAAIKKVETSKDTAIIPVHTDEDLLRLHLMLNELLFQYPETLHIQVEKFTIH